MRIDQIDLIGSINLQTVQVTEINGQLVVQSIGASPGSTPSLILGGTGAQGPQGPGGGGSGSTGPQGLRGPTGIGVDSVIGAFSGPWQTLPTVYAIEDNWVTYGGSTWYSTVGPSDGVPPSPTNSNWNLFAGAALIVGTSIPVSSSSPGSKGEIRVNNGQYLYIHTGLQWLRSSMTFSTF